MEHTTFDLHDVQAMVMAAERVGVTPIVRTPGFDPAFILRLLDMGTRLSAGSERSPDCAAFSTTSMARTHRTGLTTWLGLRKKNETILVSASQDDENMPSFWLDRHAKPPHYSTQVAHRSIGGRDLPAPPRRNNYRFRRPLCPRVEALVDGRSKGARSR